MAPARLCEFMTQVNDKASDYKKPWYAVSANRHVRTLGGLKSEVNCDICIVGAGFTGLSAGFELQKRGFSVIVLEKGDLAAGPSGRNGGQLQRGYAKPPDYLVEKFGHADAKVMLDITMEGIHLIQQRIADHNIQADFRPGVMTAAMDDNQLSDLADEVKLWKDFGYNDLALLDRNETQELVHVKSYAGAMFDPRGGHFHPYNYGLGLAQAAQDAGVQFYDQTTATEIIPGDNPVVVTEHGRVKAKYVFFAGAIRLKGSESMVRRSVTATAHMIATEPMSEELAKSVMSRDIAVCDARFIMDYYRLTGDRRMLFGGNCNYSDMDYPGEDKRLRGRMLEIFPQLKDLAITNCWHGPLEFTINRLPGLGRLYPNVYYAHGFGGQGVILTNILGAISAEAIAGDVSRFDIFAKIKHANFPGGNLLKQPMFWLGMTWYQLRDWLS